METEGRLAVAGDGARRGSRGGRWRDTGNVYVIHTLSHGDFSVMGLLPSTRGFGYCNFAKFLSSRNILVIIAPLSSHINFGIRSPRASEILLESLLAQLGLDINFQGMDALMSGLHLLPFFGLPPRRFTFDARVLLGSCLGASWAEGTYHKWYLLKCPFPVVNRQCAGRPAAHSSPRFLHQLSHGLPADGPSCCRGQGWLHSLLPIPMSFASFSCRIVLATTCSRCGMTAARGDVLALSRVLEEGGGLCPARRVPGELAVGSSPKLRVGSRTCSSVSHLQSRYRECAAFGQSSFAVL